MTFSFIVATILVTLSLFNRILHSSVGEVNLTNTETSQEVTQLGEITPEKPAEKSEVLSTLNQDEFFDLNQDGKPEKITIYSSLGKEIGDEYTDIFINDTNQPSLHLSGYFDGMQVHKIDHQGHQILEVRTVSGHSIETTFYTYGDNYLNIVPVSTAKPPSFYGIVSRNRPEFKDNNNDGTLELFAYYRHFPPKKQRTIEVYIFDGQGFIKTEEYEEILPTLYL